MILMYLVKFTGKLYEYVLRIISRLSLTNTADPTTILLSNFTPAQTAAAETLRRTDLGPYEGTLRILVVVPFRDHWHLTKNCLHYLAAQKVPNNSTLNIVLLDNRSTKPETTEGIEAALQLHPNLNCQVIKADYEFNFSRMNNDAFKAYPSDQVLFLNNDVELRDDTIIARMSAALAKIPDLMVVGCTLLYPNRRIQHLFVAPGVKIIAAHPLKGTLFDYRFAWFQEPIRPVAGVTGAVLMTRSADFVAAGYFDESLPTLAQDVDLCLRMTEGPRQFCGTVTSDHSYHLEGPTKASKFPKEEIDRFYRQWKGKEHLTRFYSRRFSRWSEQPVLTYFPEPSYPAQLFGQ